MPFRPESPSMPPAVSVFFSHSKFDDDAVTQIAEEFQKAGLQTWVDHTDLEPGDNWQERIDAALVSCDCGMLIFSPHSVDNKECASEWRAIRSQGKTLYVLYINTVDRLPYGLNTIQYTDARDDLLPVARKLALDIMKIEGSRQMVDQATLTIRLKGNLSDYSAVELEGIRERYAARIGCRVEDIQLTDKREGSVILTYEMPRDAAHKLITDIHRHSEAFPEVLSAEIVHPDQYPLTIETVRRGQVVQGLVKRIELYGAFLDIGVGTDALLHISQLGKTKIRHVTDVLNIGDIVSVYVLKADPTEKRIAVTMNKPSSRGFNQERTREQRRRGKQHREREDILQRTLRDHG
jgi:predicted RNA-binding protein with RPS1 domain